MTLAVAGGRWALALLCLGSVVAGCGGTTDDAVTVGSPAVAFAPVVHLGRDEPFMPVTARWFVERSVLWWAPGGDCDADQVAAGVRVKERPSVTTEPLFSSGLGWGTAYWRADAGCDGPRSGGRYYSNQLNRPHDSGPDRAPGLPRAAGYYLDLADGERSGAAARVVRGQRTTDHGESLFERRATDGGRGLRLTYWMLYPMDRPHAAAGGAADRVTHEGDWERVEVLLRRGDEEGSWKPVRLRLVDPDGGWRSVPWGRVRRVGGPGGADVPTHPVLFAARGSHTLYARPGRHRRAAGDGAPIALVDSAPAPCARCPRWEMWRQMSNARTGVSNTWHGFGGAWGDVGPTSLTTGPLGPHGPSWPEGTPSAQREWTERQPWGYSRSSP